MFDLFAASLILLQFLGIAAAAVTFASHFARIGVAPVPAPPPSQPVPQGFVTTTRPAFAR